MSHDESVGLLASLFRAGNQARPILLLGAGASFSSGIPLAAESVKRLARRVYAEKVNPGAVPPEHIKLTEWHDWLRKQPWFIPGEEHLSENFPLVVQHLLVPREYRKHALLDLMHPQIALGPGYRDLSKLVLRGLVRTLLTTNFDTCLPDALAELRPHVGQIAEVNRWPDDFREFDIYSRQIVWLHGRAEQYTDCNLLEETEHLNPKLVRLLTPLLRASPLVVIGYRGAERSVMQDLLKKNAKPTDGYRNGIYWCVPVGGRIHPHVSDLQTCLGTNFRLLEIAGFDELMADLGHDLRDEDCYPLAGPRRSHEAISFDDRPIAGASLEEIDADLMLAVMRQYCEKLGRKPVTRDTLLPLLREQGLLASVEGIEVPTAACILLFGLKPQDRFPQATVAATIAGKKRVVFEGNLIRQREQLREWLSSNDINPTIRVKRRATHEDRAAYAERALFELLINLLVHRDYEQNDCGHIDVEPGDSIRFENPGGLLKEVVDRVSIDESGHFEPVPNVSGLRNRSLCDVFFGISEMERAGTGLADVSTLARDSGGNAQFTHDARGRRFVVRICQPTASGGSTTVARDTRPTGVYLLNALPFMSMPEGVSVLRLRTRLSERPASLSLADAGTFVVKSDFLWSFVPLSILLDLFAPIADPEASWRDTREVIEGDADGRNILSWLLRKHFERHLDSFADQGFYVESDRRRRRAYFRGMAEGPRTLTYDSVRRKGIRRQVVKQRAEGPMAWFENEGIGYEVIQLDDVWAIRIKPFYMFTRRDAQTPLPSFARGSRATRRIKFDRNKNVEDDLTFWARFLSGGSPTINIGQEHMPDLILSGSFLSVEVPEIEDVRKDD